MQYIRVKCKAKQKYRVRKRGTTKALKVQHWKLKDLEQTLCCYSKPNLNNVRIKIPVATQKLNADGNNKVQQDSNVRPYMTSATSGGNLVHQFQSHSSIQNSYNGIP